MLRQRPGQGSVLPTPDILPLDSDEQAKVVASLGNEAQQQSKMFSRIFSTLLAACGVAVLRCSIQLWFYEDSHPLAHRVIVPNVPNVAFHASYVGYLLHLYLCHKVAQVNKWHLVPGFGMSWTLMFSWLAVFRHFEVTNVLFYWLPLGPLVLYGIAAYMYAAAKRTERDLHELDGMRYGHKEL